MHVWRSYASPCQTTCLLAGGTNVVQDYCILKGALETNIKKTRPFIQYFVIYNEYIIIYDNTKTYAYSEQEQKCTINNWEVLLSTMCTGLIFNSLGTGNAIETSKPGNICRTFDTFDDTASNCRRIICIYDTLYTTINTIDTKRY